MEFKTENIFEDCAKILSIEIDNLLDKKETINFAVCGGRSSASVFEELLKIEEINWNKIHFFVVDERRVSIDDEESNFKILKDNLLDKINIDDKNIHPYYYDRDVKEYTEELNKLGGNFDLVLLSSGEDGHIAGIYPGHHTIVNQSNEFVTFDDSPKMPPKRMSATPNMIKESDVAVILFNGKEKKKAYKMYLDLSMIVEVCPAKLVLECRKHYSIRNFD